MVSRFTRFLGIGRSKSECVEVRELSSAYLDGELDEGKAGEVGSHLDKCAPCRAFFSTLRATVGLLRAATKQSTPDALRERIRDSAHKQSPT